MATSSGTGHASDDTDEDPGTEHDADGFQRQTPNLMNQVILVIRKAQSTMPNDPECVVCDRCVDMDGTSWRNRVADSRRNLAFRLVRAIPLLTETD